ncbi:acetylornithine aminotransferase [Rickettsiella grylli]|uniref:aspartate aminotransferase family protein n=1 Tax=Rickettsiella grylli TaxID=59196 RepID=UPI0008FD0A83|nr:aspartate aminotransferase family protein [Rickettsiella grylli]OJA00325.1 acetylornithine aminotransferase [Rickettsiella grylli]
MISALMPIYPHRLPVAFEKGSGIWLTDTQGACYLDALSGIAVCGLGHAHPAITETICNQARKLIHTSNTYHIPEQERLASALSRVSGMDQVFFANSGAESNEAAIKMTRLYARQKGIEQPIIIAMNNAFHGRTMATLSVSGSERLQIGFEPLLTRFIHIPFNDETALKNTIKKYKKNIIAIMLEPIQGDGGIKIATPRFLRAIRDYCDHYDFLMILDEIQTGLCRTGPWFAYQAYNIFPDILTIAKTLGNGFPISAYCSRGKANNLFPSGKHGSTFAGSPLACAVALTVIKILEKENISAHVTEIGDYLIRKLNDCLGQYPHVVAIKGQGLMIGVELDTECRHIPKIGLKHRLLFNIVSNHTIRILPPLILQKKEADEICHRLMKSIDEFYNLPSRL